eukprot:10071699-Alexandrium_andersonii.AAC.1
MGTAGHSTSISTRHGTWPSHWHVAARALLHGAARQWAGCAGAQGAVAEQARRWRSIAYRSSAG